MIYTSYFGSLKKLNEAGIVPVSISLWDPRWVKIEKRYKLLNPTRDMLKMSNDEYIPRFMSILSKLNPEWVVDDLKVLTEYKDFALLCWEKPNEFCHRHLVSEWLNSNLNLNIIEFDKRNPEIIQADLF